MIKQIISLTLLLLLGFTISTFRAPLRMPPKNVITRNLIFNYPPLPIELSNSKFSNNLLNKQWGLKAIGAFKTKYKCSSKIVVAVVDTGIDYTHPNLINSLWKNPNEIPGDNIDNDNNGFIDDIIGWDFVLNAALPYDSHGHGTHVSGIITSASADEFGIKGVCPGVSIMILKYYDNNVYGHDNLGNLTKSIKYAIANGAQIINCSGGGLNPYPFELEAIKAAKQKGILFVAAAGNNGRNNDWTPYYPPNYDLDNIISVASISMRNRLLSSSNYGIKSVDLAAPGLDILSTLPYKRIGTMSGTSQATAFVSGAAALLASQMEVFDYKKVKSWLLNSTLPLISKSREKIRYGILAVDRALKLQHKDIKDVRTK